jgi:hypothetical protein
MQVRGVGDVTAAREREPVRGKAALELAQHRAARALGERGIGARDHDHQLALVRGEMADAGVAVRARARTPAQVADRGAERPGGHAPGRPLRRGQDATAPIALLGLARVRAQHEHGRAGSEVGPELAAAGDDVLAVGGAAVHDVGQERLDRGLSRALGRARALDLERDDRARHAQQSVRLGGRVALRSPGSKPQLADSPVGDTQLERANSRPLGHHRPFLVGGSAGHGQHAHRRVEHGHARAEPARGRADDLVEAGAALDGRRDLGQSLQRTGARAGVRVELDGACGGLRRSVVGPGCAWLGHRVECKSGG